MLFDEQEKHIISSLYYLYTKVPSHPLPRICPVSKVIFPTFTIPLPTSSGTASVPDRVP